MAQTEPTTEPALVTAGDTLVWRRSLADYPASAWTLKYRLINAGAKYDITAAASGDEHRVSVSAATSAAWTAGDYTWTAWVEGGSSERYTVGSGKLTVKPNLAAVSAAGFDTRSQAQQALDGLKAALTTYVSSRGHVAEYTIAGRMMKFRSASEIEEQIRFWERELAKEEQAERLAKGLPSRRRVLVRLR